MSQFLKKEWVRVATKDAPHGVIVSTVNMRNMPGASAEFRRLYADDGIETAVFAATDDGRVRDFLDLDMERSGDETKWEQQHDAMAKKWGRP